ncbi:MAG TPA: hypothetical protein HA362_05970 [Nanoarchaeota archaeon]|nr:hypothetical protein [Nanoarchaeota archaeon]
MKKSVILLICIFLLLINIVYAGSKISIDLNHQVIKTEQGSASSQDGSANIKETYDTKVVASGTLSRDPEVTTDFYYNFIDGDSDWSYKYKKDYTISGSGITSNQVATNDGSGTLNLEYVPGLSESYFSIDSDTGDFTLSIIGCLPSDDSGNPVSDYSNAIKTLKWISTTIATGFGGYTDNEDRAEVIGYSTSSSGNCPVYIKGNVFTDTKEVNGDLWVVQAKKTDTENEPVPFTLLGMSQGSGSIATTITYDLTITMPRISDDPEFNLDPLDISSDSDLDKLDISDGDSNVNNNENPDNANSPDNSNPPDDNGFNIDPLDITRPSDLDKLDITSDGNPSEDTTVDIDFTENVNPKTTGPEAIPLTLVPQLVPLATGKATTDLDNAKPNSINIKFNSKVNSLIIQGYYVDGNNLKKLNIATAKSSDKELSHSKEKVQITKESKDSIQNIFNEVKKNNGKIIYLYNIKPDLQNSEAIIQFKLPSSELDSNVEIIKIEDDGSKEKIPFSLQKDKDSSIITLTVQDFSYFLISTSPKSNSNLGIILGMVFGVTILLLIIYLVFRKKH